ncbi:MAG: FixH family protein [Ardenticatenaceae bacterium]|nr:FixH family protein [Ardenticatenaceae bacterium]
MSHKTKRGALRRTEKVTLAIVVLIIAAGCQRNSQVDSKTAVQIQLVSPIFPSLLVERQQLIIRVLDLDDKPIEDAHLQVKGDMTHAGMVPLVAEMTSEGDGLYAAPFNWTMAGDWVLTVSATLRDGQLEQQQIALFVDGGDSICTTNVQSSD